jgi:hypothetical protein
LRHLGGAELVQIQDADWVAIYASRTLFIALVLGLLLVTRNYKILGWALLFGMLMPVSDAWLAFQADNMIIPHVVTFAYLIVTHCVIRAVIKKQLA